VTKRDALKKCLITAIVAMGVVFCVSAGDATVKDVLLVLIPVLGTYVAASYGASYAFRLQEGKAAALERRNKIDAINRALMVMCLQYNDIAATLRRMRGVGAGDLQRMLGLPAYRSSKFDYRQNVMDLAFLMQLDNAQLILEISLEQGRFDACHESMELRSQFFVSTVEPLIEKHGINSKPASGPTVYIAFGERVFESLRNMTQSLYDHVEGTEASLIAAIHKLHGVGKKHFPAEKFFRVDRVDFDAEDADIKEPQSA